jgi:hypothetical protein
MSSILVKISDQSNTYTANEFDLAFGPNSNGLKDAKLTVSKGAVSSGSFFVEDTTPSVYIVFKYKDSILYCSCAVDLLQDGPFEEEIEVLFYGNKKQCYEWKAFKEKPNLFQAGISIAAIPVVIPVLAVYAEHKMLPFRYYKGQINPFKLIGDVISAFLLDEPPLPY